MPPVFELVVDAIWAIFWLVAAALMADELNNWPSPKPNRLKGSTALSWFTWYVTLLHQHGFHTSDVLLKQRLTFLWHLTVCGHCMSCCVLHNRNDALHNCYHPGFEPRPCTPTSCAKSALACCHVQVLLCLLSPCGFLEHAPRWRCTTYQCCVNCAPWCNASSTLRQMQLWLSTLLLGDATRPTASVPLLRASLKT